MIVNKLRLKGNLEIREQSSSRASPTIEIDGQDLSVYIKKYANRIYGKEHDSIFIGETGLRVSVEIEFL